MGNWVKKTSGDYNPIFPLKNIGDQIEGSYIGSHLTKDDNKAHTIKTDKGIFDVWGSGKLNYLLADIKADSFIRITYLGMVKAELKIKGKKVKKMIHDFDLEIYQG